DAHPAGDVALELVDAGDGDVGAVGAGDHGDGVADADVAAFGGGGVDGDFVGAARGIALGERCGGPDGFGVVVVRQALGRRAAGLDGLAVEAGHDDARRPRADVEGADAVDGLDRGDGVAVHAGRAGGRLDDDVHAVVGGGQHAVEG